MACFRFKLWWMAQRMGEKGGDVPHETQFLLVESKGAAGDEAAAAYVVFLPLVEGAFRASLQGGAGDALELCVESGDADTRATSFERALFVGAAESDPFAAISGAVAAAKSALRTFRVRAEKKLPGIVDYFGWCTWDAFYQDVTQEGVEAGLRSLIAGGAPPKFVIIDDGWQSVGTDKSATDTDEPAGEDKPPLLSRARGEGGVRAQVRLRLARHHRLLGRCPSRRRQHGAVRLQHAVPRDLAGRCQERPRHEDRLDHRPRGRPHAPARRVPLLRRAARVPRRRRGRRRQGG